MEPSEAQYLILNALETLELLAERIYDEKTGIWYIRTPSRFLPFAMLLQNGDTIPITPVSDL